ncbi:transposase [Terasakiella brassicae]|uniref:Transposase n=2 Tax=Terasakiella brassicae TaxID=1634917 RepID=A0A917FD58_9PROT|nr:transposase [Terasakiella brassicae]
MNTDRFVISDHIWEQIEPVLSGKSSDCGVTGKDNRLFLEAVLWRVRTGTPWRDLPDDFGNWNSVFKRFRRWAERGIFDRIFDRLSSDQDFEYVMVDGTIVSVHQKASGAKGGLKIRPLGVEKAD